MKQHSINIISKCDSFFKSRNNGKNSSTVVDSNSAVVLDDGERRDEGKGLLSNFKYMLFSRTCGLLKIGTTSLFLDGLLNTGTDEYSSVVVGFNLC